MSKAYWSDQVEHVHSYPTLKQYARWKEWADRQEQPMSGLIKVAVDRYCDWLESLFAEGGHDDKG